MTALKLYREAWDVRDRRLSQERSQQIERLRARFDSGRKERELARLQEQRKNQRILTGYGALLVLALIGVLSLLVYRYRAKQRSSEIIARKNHELEQLQVELKSAAATDPLTGINNRRAFLPLLEHQLARLSRGAETFSLLILDIDYFKRINDAHGHEAGDAVICGVVDRLKGALRGPDVMCRWGGEEFVVLLPSTSAEGAHVVAEKLRRIVEAEPFSFADHTISTTVTIGGAVSPQPGEEVHDVIDRADSALYQGKRDGRNRVVLVSGTELPD